VSAVFEYAQLESGVLVWTRAVDVVAAAVVVTAAAEAHARHRRCTWWVCQHFFPRRQPRHDRTGQRQSEVSAVRGGRSASRGRVLAHGHTRGERVAETRFCDQLVGVLLCVQVRYAHLVERFQPALGKVLIRRY
jgi:hypothetical protein